MIFRRPRTRYQHIGSFNGSLIARCGAATLQVGTPPARVPEGPPLGGEWCPKCIAEWKAERVQHALAKP